MTDENINREIEKLQEAMKECLNGVDITNPNQLSVTMLQMISLVVRFEMENSVMEFFKVLTNKLEGKGR